MKARVLQRLEDNVLLGHALPVHPTESPFGQLLIEVERHLQPERRHRSLRGGNRCNGSPFSGQLAAVGLNIGVIPVRCLDGSEIDALTGFKIDRRKFGFHAATASCSSFVSSSAVTAATF